MAAVGIVASTRAVRRRVGSKSRWGDRGGDGCRRRCRPTVPRVRLVAEGVSVAIAVARSERGSGATQTSAESRAESNAVEAWGCQSRERQTEQSARVRRRQRQPDEPGTRLNSACSGQRKPGRPPSRFQKRHPSRPRTVSGGGVGGGRRAEGWKRPPTGGTWPRARRHGPMAVPLFCTNTLPVGSRPFKVETASLCGATTLSSSSSHQGGSGLD